eukprot:5608667-Amphidinium_carterae.2
MHECAKRISAACTASCGLTQVVNGKEHVESAFPVCQEVPAILFLWPWMRFSEYATGALKRRCHGHLALPEWSLWCIQRPAIAEHSGKAAGSGGLASWQALAVLRKEIYTTSVTR